MCRSFGRRPAAVKQKQRPKIDFGPSLFLTSRKGKKQEKAESVPLYGGEGAVKLIFSFFKAAKERDNKSKADE